MAMVTARFSAVCEQTVAAQPRIIEFTPYVPIVKITLKELVSLKGYNKAVELSHRKVSNADI
jgi:hypothetical protein